MTLYEHLLQRDICPFRGPGHTRSQRIPIVWMSQAERVLEVRFSAEISHVCLIVVKVNNLAIHDDEHVLIIPSKPATENLPSDQSGKFAAT
jgi:hypothetical protein